jgi:hypothetical protein
LSSLQKRVRSACILSLIYFAATDRDTLQIFLAGRRIASAIGFSFPKKHRREN